MDDDGRLLADYSPIVDRYVDRVFRYIVRLPTVNMILLFLACTQILQLLTAHSSTHREPVCRPFNSLPLQSSSQLSHYSKAPRILPDHVDGF